MGDLFELFELDPFDPRASCYVQPGPSFAAALAYPL